MALRSMAFTVAREIGNESGVAVFSFVPGIVDTPLMREDLLPPMAAMLGIPIEQATAIAAQNPGYDGLMPVDHCATALVHAIVHGSEHHGQVADPFEPLDRIGVIQMPRLDPDAAPALLDVSGPQSGLYIKQYLGDVDEPEQGAGGAGRASDAGARGGSPALGHPAAEHPAGADRGTAEAGESMIADHFAAVTVLFADIVDFTPISSKLTPERAVDVLDAVFSEFDRIAGHYELEKIKTIGDCYMAVGGLPEPQADHAERVASAALEMLPALTRVGKWLDLPLSGPDRVAHRRRGGRRHRPAEVRLRPVGRHGEHREPDGDPRRRRAHPVHGASLPAAERPVHLHATRRDRHQGQGIDADLFPRRGEVARPVGTTELASSRRRLGTGGRHVA